MITKSRWTLVASLAVLSAFLLGAAKVANAQVPNSQEPALQIVSLRLNPQAPRVGEYYAILSKIRNNTSRPIRVRAEITLPEGDTPDEANILIFDW